MKPTFTPTVAGANRSAKGPSRVREGAAGIAIAGGAVASVTVLPAPAALVAGVGIALLLGNPHFQRTRPLARKLLPAAVVGLGGAMDLATVMRTGVSGFGFTLVSLLLCIALGMTIARALGVERRTAWLVTTGTAICGGSAIAAVGPVLGAEDREMSVALGTVFILNALALVVFPPIGRAAHLGEVPFGLWAAIAIHDTSSVVGAALAYGPASLAPATTVKLARALWIVPVTVALGLLERRRGRLGGQRAHPPWFILGFVLVAALATYVPSLRAAGLVLAAAARRGLVLTLFLIGLGLSRETLRSVGARPFALGVMLWLAVSFVSFLAIRAGVAPL